MSASHCLNCGQPVQSRFCADCGQKTDTHRIVLRHFVLHDMLHGVWHLERGILFTIKEAIVRPGKAALDYISGKRIRYYNVFYLCLLVIGFNLLLSHFLDSISGDSSSVKTANKTSQDIVDFFDKNIKFILLGIVPILSISAFVIFRRMKLNLAEHFIIGGICLLGKLIIATLFIVMSFVSTWLPDFFGYFIAFLAAVILFWPVWVYWNAAKGHYKVLAYSWRIFVFYLMSFLLMFIVLVAILLAIAGNGDFNISTGESAPAKTAAHSAPSS